MSMLRTETRTVVRQALDIIPVKKPFSPSQALSSLPCTLGYLSFSIVFSYLFAYIAICPY